MSDDNMPGRHKLPKLPSGFAYEQYAPDPDVIHVVRGGHGAYSIHLRHRTMEAGWCIPRPRKYGDRAPSGRGWKDALIMEAVKALTGNGLK